MSDGAPETRTGSSRAPVDVEQRIAALEERLEGIEYLLAELREERGMPPLTAPEAARLIEEERYRASATRRSR